MKKSLLMAALTLCSVAFSAQASALTDEERQEIKYASEGAPSNVTDNASFMKFEDGQFKLFKKGSNNFTCLVVRDPKGRFEPSCFNQEAMRTVFYTYQFHMAKLYSGHTEQQAMAAIAKAHLPVAETGSLVYMMSPNNKMYNYKKEKLGTTPIHHMYYFPKLPNETFALGKGSPRLWQGYPHLSALIVVIDK